MKSISTRKTIATTLALGLATTALALGTPAATQAATGSQTTSIRPMYRLYNPNSGEHFYTASSYERDQTVKAGWNYEGIGWYAPANPNSTPVYRLYNSYAGDHHYTRSKLEADTLKKLGWKDEGIGWYSYEEADAIYLLRQYNPNAVAGSHNYTASKVENDHLVSVGWKAEGTAWGAAPAPVNRRWVEPTYKTVQKTCTQSYQEKVIDQPARTETKPYQVQVYSNGMEFDLRTTTWAQINATMNPLIIEALKKGSDITSSTVTRYETVTIPEKSHMETRTRNYSCNEQVVDVPGHWEEY